MFPKEHGACGQLFPLVTAMGIGRPTAPALLLSAAALFVFVAHEPFRVLTVRRGARAARNNARKRPPGSESSQAPGADAV